MVFGKPFNALRDCGGDLFLRCRVFFFYGRRRGRRGVVWAAANNAVVETISEDIDLMV